MVTLRFYAEFDGKSFPIKAKNYLDVCNKRLKVGCQFDFFKLSDGAVYHSDHLDLCLETLPVKADEVVFALMHLDRNELQIRNLAKRVEQRWKAELKAQLNILLFSSSNNVDPLFKVANTLRSCGVSGAWPIEHSLNTFANERWWPEMIDKINTQSTAEKMRSIVSESLLAAST